MEEIVTRDYTDVTTKQIVVEMLKEDTGTHFLDSGGAYGRNWQANQTVDFEKQQPVWWSWSAWRKPDSPDMFGKPELMATVGLYYWMNTCLEFDKGLQERLDRFVVEEANESWTWLRIQEEFAEHLHARDETQREHVCVNTYNNPDTCDLSQTLQYIELYLDDEYEPSHLIVSVHGGCDVRGGYGAPKVFSLKCEYYEALDRMQVRDIGLSTYSAYWYGDGGYLSSTQESGNNAAVSVDLTEDILALPCWNIEWDHEDLDVSGLRAVIARCDDDIKALASTTLDPEQVEQARAEMVRQREKLKVQLRKEVAEILYGICEGPALIVDSGEMFIVFSDDGEIAVDEVVVYPGY